MPTVRPARASDAPAWLALRQALWPSGPEAEHREEIERYFRGDFPRGPWTVLLAVSPDGLSLGFSEVSIRTYAQGCRSSRVGYLEGWLVVPEARRHGVGRALVEQSETWARSQGCREFASDAEAENLLSAEAHRALGFADAGLVRCFRKDSVRAIGRLPLTRGEASRPPSARRAEAHGSFDAQRDLGYALFHGEGVRRDRNLAVTWYRRAAPQDDAKAQYNLGLCYLHGDGVSLSTARARHWFQRAAARGHPGAKRKLRIPPPGHADS